MKVALNATQLLSPLTGVGQYALQLAKGLQKSGMVDLEFFYLRHWSKLLHARGDLRVARWGSLFKRFVPFPYEVARAAQQSAFTRGVTQLRPALYHEPSFQGLRFDGPTIITVHDLSWIRHPETHPLERVRTMERQFPKAIERADRLIAVSDFTRRELVDVFGVAPSRLAITLEAPRDIFRPRAAEECATVLAHHNLQYRRFLLCVGTFEPRKNLELAIVAYASMPQAFRRAHPLVLVGMHGWLTSRLEALLHPLVETGEARPLGYISDDALVALYASALALVYPSVYEGFGLPPLEAMACGTPVIASNRASLPEVVGDAGDLIEPDDVDGLRNAIFRLRESPPYFEERSAAGLARAATFSWARCASETVNVYRQALNAA